MKCEHHGARARPEWYVRKQREARESLNLKRKTKRSRKRKNLAKARDDKNPAA
jgi:hypothetical protein